MFAMLAPVPAEILADGFEVKNPCGLVAFGTGAPSEEKSGAWSFEFFSKQEFVEGKGALKVLIYGSSTGVKGQPHPLYRAGHVIAVGVYEGIAPAKAWKHPDPTLRPKIARETDTKWTMFWEVSQLRLLAKEDQIPLKKLKLPGTGKLKAYAGTPPRGPMLVIVPEEFTKSL
jgi:hypothetical protein